MNRAWMLELYMAAPRLLLAGLIVLLGAALALLPLQWATFLLIGSIALAVFLIRPQVALCLLAFAVPFGSIRELPLGPVSVGGAELLLAVLLAAWFARMVAARRIWVPRTPLLLPLSVLIAVLLLATLPASSLELSAKEIVKWLEVAMIYCFMAEALDDRWGQWLVWALLAAGSGEALVGVYQFLRRVGPEGFLLFGRFMRAYGHFAQPNPFAGYLGLTLPLAYALTVDSLRAWWSSLRERSRPVLVSCSGETILGTTLARGVPETADVVTTNQEQQRGTLARRLERIMVRVGPVVAFSVMFVAMVMSWSRGAWVGMAAALLVVTVVRSPAKPLAGRSAALLSPARPMAGRSAALRSRGGLVAVLAVGLVVAYVLLAGGGRYLPAVLVQRVTDLVPFLGGVDVVSVEVNDANWAVIERMAHWLAAVGMLTDHPWLGVGIGNYPVAYPQYALGRWRDPLGHAHNYYLNIAAEAGILGLGAYLMLFAACLGVAWRTIRRTEGYWRAVALGGLGVLVHLCVHNLFDNLFVHSMNVQLGLILGLLFLAERHGVGRHVPAD